ncbi:hypothetical protein JTE90_012330 [Oedothorax gibbosus]|uniref:Uncharacterized protein n=1 Tax=Oedothorax gibbosus TaxID=931172 RepID=A0AAV6VLG5_9ARAC|nr:hypothetical protein JTE90_012330 [Oedothorax gibbosus]
MVFYKVLSTDATKNGGGLGGSFVVSGQQKHSHLDMIRWSDPACLVVFNERGRFVGVGLVSTGAYGWKLYVVVRRRYTNNDVLGMACLALVVEQQIAAEFQQPNV